MTAPSADPDSLRYATWWEPVLARPGRRLLERIEAAPATYLDVGAGTGALALAAADRWPDARIVALDASAGMLSVARRQVAREWPAADAGRFEWLLADATAMPLDDASVDVATASFVLQVVDDRPAVLREILRVLRPGGVLGLTTWIAGDLLMVADEVFEALVAEMGLDDEGHGFRPGRTTDYRTLGEAARELAEAGFDEVDVRADELRHAWTREEYFHFKELYDDRELFESLGRAERDRFRESVRAAGATLPDSAFSVRGPLVSAIARRPGG